MSGNEVNYRMILEQRKGQADQVDRMLESATAELEILEHEREELEQAQVIIQNVAQETQKQLKYHVSELVTLALAAVFDDPYEFEVDFQQRRNQTEADIYFMREGERVDPMSGTGGGAIDVAAFGLRVSLWSLNKNRSRPILILDEPFSRLKGEEANVRAIQLVKEVSKRLGLQIIMVSDERVPLEEIEAGADVVHRVTKKKGRGKYARGVASVASTKSKNARDL